MEAVVHTDKTNSIYLFIQFIFGCLFYLFMYLFFIISFLETPQEYLVLLSN